MGRQWASCTGSSSYLVHFQRLLLQAFNALFRALASNVHHSTEKPKYALLQPLIM